MLKLRSISFASPGLRSSSLRAERRSPGALRIGLILFAMCSWTGVASTACARHRNYYGGGSGGGGYGTGTGLTSTNTTGTNTTGTGSSGGTCAALLSCAIGCGTDALCVNNCVAQASPLAQQQYATLAACTESNACSNPLSCPACNTELNDCLSGSSGTGGNGGGGGVGGGCTTCSDAITVGIGAPLCYNSQPLYDALTSCICVTGCPVDCSGICKGQPNTSACETCIMSQCQYEFDACASDA